MSTRCQIGFFETMPNVQTMIKELNKGGPTTAVALIYKHESGAPPNIKPDLQAYLDRCDRRDDPSYAAAWYLYALIAQHIEIYKKIRPDTDGVTYTGHGIDHEYHGDIDYFYAVCKGKIKVYRCGCDRWGADL